VLKYYATVLEKGVRIYVLKDPGLIQIQEEIWVRNFLIIGSESATSVLTKFLKKQIKMDRVQVDLNN